MSKQDELLRPPTIIIAGISRLPESISANGNVTNFNIELEIDPKDYKIVDVSYVTLPLLIGKILSSALLGQNVEKGIKEAVEQIEKRYFGVVKRAMIAALEDAFRNYKIALEEIKKQ